MKKTPSEESRSQIPSLLKGEAVLRRIMTVTGPISAEAAGTTSSHEHVLIDLWNLFPSYNNILDDEHLAVAELTLLSDSGGRTLVDCTSNGIGRNPAALRRISMESGMQ